MKKINKDNDAGKLEIKIVLWVSFYDNEWNPFTENKNA